MAPGRHLADAIAFALLPRIGCAAFREGVERHGSAADAFRRIPDNGARHRALVDAQAVIARADARSIALVVQGEPGYPQCLLELHDPPAFLTALGDTALLTRRRVGIVGTRHASASGERIACAMAERIVRAGAVVVSGMAFGIDAAAHRGALDAGGATIAVLGGGVDVPYPPAHRALHERIAGQGLVLSEAPIGTRPVKGAFPKRNRIIAALSETLVVIEAGERSGALITSRHALELGRTVAAVPGPIDSPRHVGSNQLLADGAQFLSRIEDVIALAGLEQSSTPTEIMSAAVVSDASHDSILELVRRGVSDVEDLASSADLGPRELAEAISRLEMEGRLVVTMTGGVTLSDRERGLRV